MTPVDTKYLQWQARLLDMSKRNRLIYFRETKRSSIQVTEPSSDSIFQSLVSEERKLTFAQRNPKQFSFDPESVTPDGAQQDSAQPPLRPGEIRGSLSGQSLETALYTIRSKTRTALEEQGVNILFLAFGMLKWYETAESSELISTPLVLVPVELDRISVTRLYTLELAEDDILLNPTLAYKLQTDFRLTLPSLPEDWSTNSLSSILDGIRAAIGGQSRWSITPDVSLGLFSFEKLVMLKDLESRAATAKQHPIVRALAGDRSGLVPITEDLPKAEELDAKIVPKETFQILDADSSQQEAIAKAKHSVSLVVQGPPGTGKSQTIANLIAEFLAQDKKVLFVSEKQAALEVVYQRLEPTGLHEYCLKAHGHKASKVEILAQLGRALENHESLRNGSLDELDQVGTVRAQLNAYVEMLHTEMFTLHLTPYHVHGLLAERADAPPINYGMSSIGSIDKVKLNEMRDAVSDLAASSPAWQHYQDHPWRDTPLRQFSFQLKSDAEFHLREAINVIDRIKETSTRLANFFGLTFPVGLNELDAFEQIVTQAVLSPLPPTTWLGETDLQQVRRELDEARQISSDYTTQHEKLLALNSSDLLTFDDLSAMRLRFETNYRFILRIFNANYKQDLQRVQATATTPRKIRYVEALTLLQLAERINKGKKWIDDKRDLHQLLFGDYYRGLDTKWEEVSSALSWTENIRSFFGANPIPPGFIDSVCKQPQQLTGVKLIVDELVSENKRLHEELSALAAVVPADRLSVVGSANQPPTWLALRDSLQTQLAEIDKLEEWLHFQKARTWLEQLGLTSFVTGVISTQPPPDQLTRAFEKRFYHLWLDAAYAQASILGLNSDQRARLIEQFRTLDRRQLELARGRLRSRLQAYRPDASMLNARSSEVAILKRELLRRRHHPIRRLFSEIPNLLLALTPCLMMSPLSVSMFLSKGDFEFDAVIFDEASQVVPEDAIAAIIRAKQLIVAGDNQQLPPTSFFKSLGIDNEETEDDSGDEVLESILQECSIFLPNAYLKWHYRSRHESLIAFSNYNFYQNRLVTFPSAVQSEPHLGIEFIHVSSGVYDRGRSRKNREEARQVAERVFDHFDKFPERSLGVVAFSEAQREAIEEELERLVRERSQHESFLNQRGLDAFFVKNLENVQGDERDVMFFSVGYGKDANGMMTMNFGPLNGENGARRLNVAITRARYHVKLISSILPEDISLSNPSRGVQLLRTYLEYARSGGSTKSLLGEVSPNPQGESESPFEEAVFQELSARGLILHKQVGCSGYRIDLAVVDPKNSGRYLLGIECDGATYHSAKTARDRDRLRQQVLEGLGWKLLRIWSRDWIADPTSQVKRVLGALLPASELRPQTAIPQAETKQYGFDVSTPKLELTERNSSNAPMGNSLPEGVIIYQTAQLPKMGPQMLFWSTPATEMALLLTTLVAREGPIAVENACKRVAACWGFERMTKLVERRVRHAIREASVQKKILVRDDFLWPLNLVQVPVRRPPDGESPRKIEEIALEEITHAAYIQLQNAFSLTRDDLIIETARLLGYARTSERIRGRIGNAIDLLVSSNRARIRNDKLELPH